MNIDQNIFVFETGVTGYQIIPSGDEGQGYYTGTFPLFSTQIDLTGYLSTGLYSSGLQGVTNYYSTGSPTVLLEYLTGYVSSFGMQKIQIFMQTTTSDIISSSWDYTLFNDI